MPPAWTLLINAGILPTLDAATQRHLGQRIQGLDDAKKRGHMKDIVLAKFSQMVNLKKLLIDTGNKILVEANARDNYFGIGLPLTHKDVLVPRKWHKDGNQLGTIPQCAQRWKKLKWTISYFSTFGGFIW